MEVEEGMGGINGDGGGNKINEKNNKLFSYVQKKMQNILKDSS